VDWWHEQWRKDDPLGIPYLFVLIGIYVGANLTPPVVVAVGMSFIVPVERWFAVLAVLMGWAIQWRLWPVIYGRIGTAIYIGVAAAWIVGAFVAGSLLGPVVALALLIPAVEISIWAIDKGQEWKQEADWAAAGAFLDAIEHDEGEGSWSHYYPRRVELRGRMVATWHVEEAHANLALDEWDAEASTRGFGRGDDRYWSEAEPWLGDRCGVSRAD
jgi:hypothetical protein